MSKQLRVAVIGDQFVGSELFVAALERHLVPVVGAVDVAALQVSWPDTPLQHNDEVQEFVGDEAAVAALACEAEVLLTHVAPVTRQVIAGAAHLRVIGCCRGGPVNINLAAATERGIPVVHAPARNSQAVVEFTVGLILAECRGIARAHRCPSRSRKGLVDVVKLMERKSHLAQIVEAFGATSGFTSGLHSGHQQGDEDPDNRDHDQ